MQSLEVKSYQDRRHLLAGGIPTPNDYYVENTVKVSLEIKNFNAV